ncbi:MAG: phage tail tape measure protein, partial [Muribaculaceae bacterium]|nr:phage tail tape measure protein [Muribaculaceae bacterium]
MAGRDTAGLSALKDEITELSQRVPVARDALANGLYQVISNGVPEDNWISYLEASSRSAIGGIADLGQVVGVTSTIIKNYGLSWDQAAAIQDKIQLTAKNGVTSFEQLAGALPKVTANAATLGISVNDLMASFATLTGVSGNTAEVATQLGAVMTALVKPPTEAAKIAAQMGVQFDAAAIKAAGGFQAFLTSLDTTIKAYAARTGQLEQEIYGRLFGSAEALRALIPLNGELASKFAENIESMQKSAGTMDAAFEDMADTETAAAQRIKNSFAGLYDTVSKIVSPAKPFLDMGIGALSAAANISILVSSTGALRAAFARSGIVRAVQALGHAFDRSSIQALRMAASARSAAMAANLCQKAMLGFGVLGGIGLLIWQLSESLDAYNVKARTAAEIEKDLNSIRSAAASRLVEQQQKIELLVQAAQNETLSLVERKKAVDELNRIIPDYNASLDATSGKYKANTQALQDYITELTRLYEIEGAKDKLAEYGRRKVEINEQIET